MEISLVSKFFQFAMGNGIVLLLGFISSPIITRIISPNQMGKFSMFNTITNLVLVIILLGIDQSYVRYYYEEDESNRGKLLRTCVKIPIILNIIIGILFLIFYKSISIYIVAEESIVMIIFMIIHLTTSIISRFALLQVRMSQKAKLYSMLNVIMKVSYLIFVWVLFYIYRDNYMTLIMATIISNLVMTLIAVFIEREQWFDKNLNCIKSTKKDIIKYGIPFVFSMAITWIFQSVDRIAIKSFCGYEQVGLYSGAMNIISLLNAFQNAFTTFWVPVAYEKFSSNPENKIFFTKVNKIVSVVMLLLAILLISSKDILVLLLGEEYRQAAFIFPFLVFMPIMYTISETTVLGINFKKKTNMHIYIAIISAITNIIGNMILVPLYGAKGAAISTGIAYIIFFISRTYLSNKYYKVDYSLIKFAIASTITYILAAISSFYKFNFIIMIMTIISFISILILYKDIFIDGINSIKKITFQKNNKRKII